MELHKVESSTIDAIGYGALGYASMHGSSTEVGTLQVHFLDGSIYEYYDVPVAIYTSIMLDKSKKGALHRLVESAGYQYRKVRGKRRA